MTEAPKRRRRRRTPKANGLDYSLLPRLILEHYGAGISTASAEVLLAAWSWYERGRADALVAEVAALRQVIGERGLAKAAPARQVTKSLEQIAWTPKPQVFPPGHGEVYHPGERLPEAPADAALDDFTEPESNGGAQAADDPRYSAIGHYSADVVAPIVRHAEALAKNPIFGAQVARELLVDGEQRCADPPSGIVGQVEAKLRKHDMLRGETWKGMEEV